MPNYKIIPYGFSHQFDVKARNIEEAKKVLGSLLYEMGLNESEINFCLNDAIIEK